jgi:hypothetical protein
MRTTGQSFGVAQSVAFKSSESNLRSRTTNTRPSYGRKQPIFLFGIYAYRFDPKQAFRYPRSLALMRTPNPRIIAEDVWAKLLWAGLNLELSDLPRSKNVSSEAAGPRYPLALIRALTMVWLFAGLRKDEISRLRTGCVRWQ